MQTIAICEPQILHRRRLLSLDEHAFDIVTPEAAYWAGFLFADGCVCGSYFAVELAAQDRAHLELFRSFLGSAHKITSVRRPGRALGGLDFVRLQIFSKRIVCVLSHYGVIPKKTATARVPKSLALNADFWRGVLDGDGSIDSCIRQSRESHFRFQPMVRMCGTAEVCNTFAIFARRRAHCNMQILPNKSIFIASCGGRLQVTRLLRVLYAREGPRLKRKYRRFIKIDEIAKAYEQRQAERRARTCGEVACKTTLFKNSRCYIHYWRWYNARRRHGLTGGGRTSGSRPTGDLLRSLAKGHFTQ